MKLVQITEFVLRLEKVPRGERPIWETHLEDNQRIIGYVNRWSADYGYRKTVDHYATILVETRL